MSQHVTSLPVSARQAPATSPTYPVPTTAMCMSDVCYELGTNSALPLSRMRVLSLPVILIPVVATVVADFVIRIVEDSPQDPGVSARELANRLPGRVALRVARPDDE